MQAPRGLASMKVQIAESARELPYAGMDSTALEKLRKEVGDRLKKVRELIDPNRTRIAEEFGTSHTTWSHWERGNAFPDEVVMIEFCNKYDVSMDFIYRGVRRGLNEYLLTLLLKAHPELLEQQGPAPGPQVRVEDSHLRAQPEPGGAGSAGGAAPAAAAAEAEATTGAGSSVGSGQGTGSEWGAERRSLGRLGSQATTGPRSSPYNSDGPCSGDTAARRNGPFSNGFGRRTPPTRAGRAWQCRGGVCPCGASGHVGSFGQ